MKRFYLSFLVLTATVTLAACGKTNLANNPFAPSPATSDPASPPTAASPSPSAPVAIPSALSPATAPSPQASAPANGSGQTYQQAEGLFEISFPQGYSYQETNSGITFASADNGFGGVVDYGSAQGATLTTQQLEDALKQEYENRLDQVSWQNSKIQPDGSIRVDWVGRDKEGRDLDAISFIEQRGDTIFILNLFGVDKPYNDYNSEAEAIVASYKVKQQ